MMYAQDYDERYPSLQNDGGPFVYNGYNHSRMLWYMAIEPYHKNIQIFNCPSSEVTWRGQYTGDTRYGVNCRVTYYDSNPRGGSSLAEIAYPADTVIIADADWTHSTADYGWSNSYMLTIPFHVSRFIPQRHNGGANLVLCDGHAKWYAIQVDPSYTGTGSPPLTIPPAGVKWYSNGSQ